MAKPSLFSRLKRFWHKSRQQQNSGFTLLELLVVVAIASGIISGLMYIVVELTSADQRESSLTETQREMQLSLDYISTELRQAVYVYTGECLAGQTANPDTEPPTPYCPGLSNYIPSSINNANSVPILAFWKHQPFPDAVRNLCAAGNASNDTSCSTASSYALVVYALTLNQPSDVWKGRARITRYILSQFNSEGVANAGYVNPLIPRTSFDSWPIAPATNTNLQAARGAGNPVTLVDFVDNGRGAAASNTNVADCPVGYSISPPDSMLTGNFSGVRSFYACISRGQVLGVNRDIVLFLRGNAYGRPGIRSDGKFLPTLETQVLSRGVLGKNPGAGTGN